jgi:uncharacterized membrane protein
MLFGAMLMLPGVLGFLGIIDDTHWKRKVAGAALVVLFLPLGGACIG